MPFSVGASDPVKGRRGANLWFPEFLAGPLVECQGRVGNFLSKLDLQKWHTSENF
jgi:hypothetical protein